MNARRVTGTAMPTTLRTEVIGMNQITEIRSEPGESKTDRTRKMVETAIEDLAEALERGESDTLQRYLSLMARFHRYSPGNLLLVWSQRPDAQRVAGFHTWKELGRNVKRGEKGILILAPMISRKRSDEEEGEESDRLYGFKPVYVFDISQTDGKELPEFATVKGDPGSHLERLKKVVSESGVRVEYSDAIGSALGMSSGGKIRLRKGLPTAEEFSVLAHEFAHELLHQGQEKDEKSRTTLETEAEAVAFVVCQAVGLDTNTASSDYIRLYDGNKETLSESLEAIQAAARKILAGMT